MITKRISLTLAALLGIGLAIGQGAGAQVIVQTFTVPAGSMVPLTNGNFTFDLFDSTLGVLDSVTVALSTSITATVDVFDTGGTQSFSNATATIPITLTAPDGITSTATAVAGPIGGTVSTIVTQFPGITANANNTQNVPGADFSFYEGVGLVTAPLDVTSTNGSYSGTGPANGTIGFGGSATAGATVTITYLYQPAGTIPEPGATTFLAAGVLGSLGMVIRRRRK
jgi:hypothetical protein